MPLQLLVLWLVFHLRLLLALGKMVVVVKEVRPWMWLRLARPFLHLRWRPPSLHLLLVPLFHHAPVWLQHRLAVSHFAP